MKERDSNIELLRVVATLMILMVHLSGWLLTFIGIDSFWIGGTAMAITRSGLNSICCIGVPLFVLISGYFSIKPKVRSILNLFTCLAFFYLGSYIVNCWITGDAVFQHYRVLRNLMAFSSENWFIQCYLFLVLLTPILNAFVEKVSERILANWLGCTILICIWKLYMPALGRFVSYCSPIQLLAAVSLFLIFTRIQFQSKFINWLGVSCLAAFLLHTREPVMCWMIRADENLFSSHNAILYLIGSIVVVLAIFIFAVLLDKIRILICNPILNMVDKTLEKWKKN